MIKRQAKVSERIVAFIINFLFLSFYYSTIAKLPKWLDGDPRTYTFLGFGSFYLMHVFLVLLLCLIMRRLNGSLGGVLLGLRFYDIGKAHLSTKGFLIRNIPMIIFLISGLSHYLDNMTPTKNIIYQIIGSLSVLTILLSGLVLLGTRQYSLMDSISRTEVVKLTNGADDQNVNIGKQDA